MIASQPFPAGTVIAEQYQVIRMIGQGGMATVYLAVDLHTGVEVAVKIMHEELANDPEFVRRFATEARAAASLDHPNIARVLDYGSHDGIRYIVQEYIEGSTLKDIIQNHGPIDYRYATPILIQIGLALEHAHRREVIHRDIKPQNILITEDMVAKVADFGIARASTTNTITLTGGVVMGSVHYFSPEQARGGQVTARSDLYSLGVVFYEMLTGHLPFDGESSVAVAIKHLQEVPPPPSTYVESLPPALDNIVNRAIQKNPDARYQTAREFVDELDAFMIEPDGVYGIIPKTGNGWEGASTSALSVESSGGSDYGKMNEIERTLNKRRSSKYRDVAVAVTVVVVAIALLALLTVWLVKHFAPDNPTPVLQNEITLKDFTGSEIDDIQDDIDILEKAGVIVERLYEVSDTVPADIVLRQEPASDGSLKIKPKGARLKIYVSLGQNSAVVPKVAGETFQLADIALRTEGFRVQFTAEQSDDVPKDLVIRTNPPEGELVPIGSTIELFYSTGPALVKVPDLVGQTYQNAIEMLNERSLILGGETPYAPEPIPENDKFVIKQSPEPDTQLPPNSRVTVVVGTHAMLEQFLNPTTRRISAVMPLTRGLTFRQAKALLDELDVSRYTMRLWQHSTSTLDPNNDAHRDLIYILEQTPAPGETFNPQNGVELVFGSYEDYQRFLNPTEPPQPTEPPAPPATTAPPPATEPAPTPAPTEAGD